MLTSSQGGQHRPFQGTGAEGPRRQAGQPCRQRGKAVSPGSCCHDNSLQGCGPSLGDLRKPRVGFWFRDSCSLVRLYFCGRYRVSLPSECLSSTDPMEVWFPFAGPVCLDLELRSSALSSPEVPPAATASAFFPNDTRGSTLVSRLAAWDCSRLCPAWGSQAHLPHPRPGGNSQVGNAMTRAPLFCFWPHPN